MLTGSGPSYLQQTKPFTRATALAGFMRSGTSGTLKLWALVEGSKRSINMPKDNYWRGGLETHASND